MKEMILKRVACDGIRPTFGVLVYNGLPFAATLEDPWRNNMVGESCIPLGTYRCIRCRKSPDYGFKDSPKFGDTFQVYDVDGRSRILFHKGNTEEDTRGCILIGEQFDVLGGIPAVLVSRKGFGEFMEILKYDDEFTLKITDHYNEV